MTIHLILGGARSGKSRYAQTSAEQAAAGRPLVMIATAEPLDAEMQARIAAHRRARGAAWTTREIPRALPEAIAAITAPSCVVVDCLTLWLTNLMLDGSDLGAALDALAQAANTMPGDLWLVSNEVGSGVVPAAPLGRAFRDESGRMNQRLAAAADDVTLIVAGLPLALKKGSS